MNLGYTDRMKRTPLRRTTPLKARKRPVAKSKPRIRKGTLYKAINPLTGRIVSVKTAKGKAWKAFARFIRARDPYCITCGDRTTEAGHFLHNSDKENKQLGGNLAWYDERNVNGQCGVCNRHNGGRGPIYSLRLEEKYGHGILQELYTKFRTEKKWTMEEVLAVESEYQRRYSQIL